MKRGKIPAPAKPACICPGRIPYQAHWIEGCPAWRDRRGAPPQKKTAKRAAYLAKWHEERDAMRRVIKHDGIRAQIDACVGRSAETLDRVADAMRAALGAP